MTETAGMPAGAPATPKPERTADPKGGNSNRDLPRSVEQLLRWLDPADYRHVETVLCHLPFVQDMVMAIRVVDTIWGIADRAQNRTGKNRIRGAEMDGFRDRLDEGVRTVLTACMELAERVGRTDKLAKHRKILKRHGFTLPKNLDQDDSMGKPDKKPGAKTNAA